jgi:hypothetical protein
MIALYLVVNSTFVHGFIAFGPNDMRPHNSCMIVQKQDLKPK